MLQRIKSFVFSKHFLKHFGLVVLFYLVLVFVTSLYLDFSTNHGEKIEVPSFIGMNGETAKQKIEALGLQYQIVDSIYDPNSPEGTVVEQLVEPTTVSKVCVKSGRIIGLRLTKRSQLIEMPGLINKQIQFAESILEQRGLRYRIQYRPTTEANGSVLDQLYKGRRVKEGDRIPMGAVITLIVGQNDLGEPIPLLDFVGMTMDEAKYVMDTIGITSFTFVCAECATREDSLSARIFSQTPEYIEETTAYKSTQFTFSLQLNTESPIEFP